LDMGPAFSDIACFFDIQRLTDRRRGEPVFARLSAVNGRSQNGAGRGGKPLGSGRNITGGDGGRKDQCGQRTEIKDTEHGFPQRRTQDNSTDELRHIASALNPA
jgi:hypothetical protein